MELAIIMEQIAGQPIAAAPARESRATSFRGHHHEEKVLLVLTLIIGAIVGLVVVAFIPLTENLGGRLYPPGGAAWRRVLIPILGALSTGFLLFRYFPNARGVESRKRRRRSSCEMDMSASGQFSASSAFARFH
jgi:hypothetical protein